jgi:hypothetical protein
MNANLVGNLVLEEIEVQPPRANMIAKAVDPLGGYLAGLRLAARSSTWQKGNAPVNAGHGDELESCGNLMKSDDPGSDDSSVQPRVDLRSRQRVVAAEHGREAGGRSGNAHGWGAGRHQPTHGTKVTTNWADNGA